MKMKSILVSIVIFTLSFSAFAQEKKVEIKENKTATTKVTSAKEPTASKFKNVTFKSSLHCHSCVKKVESELPYMVNGLQEVTCDLEKNTITVIYNSNKTTSDAIKKSIIKLGYKADDPYAPPTGCSKPCTGKSGNTQPPKKCSGDHQH